jgi:hypothetical protein
MTDCTGLTAEAMLSNKTTDEVPNDGTGTNISVNEFAELSICSE